MNTWGNSSIETMSKARDSSMLLNSISNSLYRFLAEKSVDRRKEIYGFYESVINELIFLIRSDSLIILVCLINVQNDFIS